MASVKTGVPVFGYENKVRVQRRHAVSGAAIGRGLSQVGLTVGVCRCVTGTASGPTPAQQTDAGPGVRVCRVVFNDATACPRRGLPGRDRNCRDSGDSASRHHCGLRHTGGTRAGWREVPSVALVRSVNDFLAAPNGAIYLRLGLAGKRKGRRVGRTTHDESRKDRRQSFRLTRNGICAVRDSTAACLWPRSARSGFAGPAICRRNPSSVSSIIRGPDGFTTTPVSS